MPLQKEIFLVRRSRSSAAPGNKTMTLAIIENEPLAKYTSWRIGGPARFFANVGDPEQLAEALAWARRFVDHPVDVLAAAKAAVDGQVDRP